MRQHSSHNRIPVYLTYQRLALVSAMLIALAWNSNAFSGKLDDAAPHDASDKGSAVTQSAAPPVVIATGKLYFYRPGRFLGKITHFSAYVDDTFLAEIHNGEYASMEVPAGAVVITAATPITGKHHIPFGGPWASEPGCVGLKWRRLALESIVDIEGCKGQISALANRCGSTVEGCFMCTLKTIHIPSCNNQLNGASLGYELLQQAVTSARLKLDVEAGKTYYVRWSLSLTNRPLIYKMELVDESTGVKEIKHEHLSKETDEGNLGQVSIRPTAAQSEIHDAAKNGNLAKVQALLKDNPALVSSKAENYSGGTPLHVAAGWGQKEVAQLLLGNKAAVDARNNNSYTPLYVAARSGRKDVVELLLANGADVNAKGIEGKTPLGAVLSEMSRFPRPGQEDVADLLRQHGGQESVPNAGDTSGQSKEASATTHKTDALPVNPLVQALRDQAAQKIKWFPPSPPASAFEVFVTPEIKAWQQEYDQEKYVYSQAGSELKVFGEDMSVFVLQRKNNDFIATTDIPAENGEASTKGVVMLIRNQDPSNGKTVQETALSGVVWTPRTTALAKLDLTGSGNITTSPDFSLDAFKSSPLVIPFANGYAINLFGQKVDKHGLVDACTRPKGNYVTDDGKPLYGRLVRSHSGKLEEIVLTPAADLPCQHGGHE